MSDDRPLAIVLARTEAEASILSERLTALRVRAATGTTSKEALGALLWRPAPRLALITASCMATEGVAFLRILRTQAGDTGRLPVAVVGSLSDAPAFVQREAKRLKVRFELPAPPDAQLLRNVLVQTGVRTARHSTPSTRVPLAPPGTSSSRGRARTSPAMLVRRPPQDRRPPTMDGRTGGISLGPTMRIRVDGKTEILVIDSAEPRQVTLKGTAQLPEDQTLHLVHESRIRVGVERRKISVRVLGRVLSTRTEDRTNTYEIEVVAATPGTDWDALRERVAKG